MMDFDPEDKEERKINFEVTDNLDAYYISLEDILNKPVNKPVISK